MYNLSYFKTEDRNEVLRYMYAHSFATLCGSDADGRPVATQVPLLIKEQDGKLTLEGHVMRNTDHHKAFAQNPNVLALFTGAHTYVSASWYSNPNQASTWNYQSVHVRGRLNFLEEEELRRILKETTEKYENHRESPASFHNLPPEYVNKLIKAIIGFRIEVEEIGNVFKLSQNRDEKSFDTIMEKLNAQDEDGRKIAEEMKRIKSNLFKK